MSLLFERSLNLGSVTPLAGAYLRTYKYSRFSSLYIDSGMLPFSIWCDNNLYVTGQLYGVLATPFEHVSQVRECCHIADAIRDVSKHMISFEVAIMYIMVIRPPG